MTTARRIITTAALAFSLAAAAAPATFARPADQGVTSAAHPATAVYSRQDKSIVPPGNSTSTPATAASVSTPPTIVHVTAANSGFDWGDAAIGAAGGIVLSMCALGGALAISQRRARRTGHTTAVTS